MTSLETHQQNTKEVEDRLLEFEDVRQGMEVTAILIPTHTKNQ